MKPFTVTGAEWDLIQKALPLFHELFELTQSGLALAEPKCQGKMAEIRTILGITPEEANWVENLELWCACAQLAKGLANVEPASGGGMMLVKAA